MPASQKEKLNSSLDLYLQTHAKEFKPITFKKLMVLAREKNVNLTRDQLLLKITPKKGKCITVKYCHFSNNYLYDKKVTELVCIDLKGDHLVRFFVKDIKSISYQLVQVGFMDVFSEVFRNIK